MAGFGFGGVRRRYTVGGCLGLRTVIGLLVCIAIMMIFVSVTRGIPLLPPKKAASVAESVRDFADSNRITLQQGRIAYAGSAVLFIGKGEEYETATRLVDPTHGETFLNGSFGGRGATWCVAVKRGDTVTVTTQAGVQASALMCGPLGQPVLPAK